MTDTDFVKRLRHNYTGPHMLLEAADEVERLRAENQQAWNECEKNDEAKRHALAEVERLRAALNDLLNDCINFDGGKLTDSIMAKASAVLRGR